MGLFSDWKEYAFSEDYFCDCMPWGGLVHPAVIQNKDTSVFSVIEYDAYEQNDEKITLPEFKNGWSIWIERQHDENTDRNYIVICCNPFIGKSNRIINSIAGNSTGIQNFKIDFYDTILKIAACISVVTPCRIIENHELLKFLSFSLAIKQLDFPMPEVPLYLDALLSQDLKIKTPAAANDVYIDGKRLIVLSLPAMANDAQMKFIYDAMDNINYRHVQRMLLFDNKRALKEEARYTSHWCSGRRSIKQKINMGILNRINGFHMDCFFILQNNDIYDRTVLYLKNVLNLLELPYVFEDYSLKDVWCASLPGMFRVNAAAPIIGFSSIDELLVHFKQTEKDTYNVQA